MINVTGEHTDNINTFLNKVEEYKGCCYFRGQADVSWNISPSIFRDNNAMKDESKSIAELYSDAEHKRILFKILEMQHYGSKTRLCDMTVNPLVALFFAIDGDGENNKDGCIYILDSTEKFPIDSIEVKIMTKVATSDIQNIIQLKDEVKKDFGIEFTEDELRMILFRNVIIEYGYELAFSNPRSHLQGGTAIFFGYSSPDGELIERNNNYGIRNIIKKLIIPSSKKKYFRDELKKRGITSESLYNRIFEYRLNTHNPINYIIEVDSITLRHDFNKVVLWVRIDDIRFIYDDVFPIVEQVFRGIKLKYGDASRIFMIVYYDAEDKKALNYICHVDPINDFKSFTIKWNTDYHKRRMEYTNHQISSQEIISRFEPIIVEFINCWESVKDKNSKLREKIIGREEYESLLKEFNKKLRKLAYWDAQDIAHGGEKIFEYQESGHRLIENIIFLIEDQLMYLNRKANDYLLQWMYDNRNSDCDRSYLQYKEKRSDIL